jgi:hypothetical protein
MYWKTFTGKENLDWEGKKFYKHLLKNRPVVFEFLFNETPH